MKAAEAIKELATNNADTQNAIAKAGGIGPLLALLQSRSVSAQAESAGALGQLSR